MVILLLYKHRAPDRTPGKIKWFYWLMLKSRWPMSDKKSR